MNRYIDNKGFTLIELLAVFVILLSVSFVAVGAVMSSLEKGEIDECIQQQKMAVSAAKMFFSLDGSGLVEVSVQELINKGYIDDDTSLLNDSDKITVTSSGYKYNDGVIGASCN